jgi:hypothetical protein
MAQNLEAASPWAATVLQAAPQGKGANILNNTPPFVASHRERLVRPYLKLRPRVEITPLAFVLLIGFWFAFEIIILKRFPVILKHSLHG